MRYLTFGFIILLSLTSCRKEKASWESNWTLPIVNDTLDLKNLVRDSLVGVNGSGFYQLEINRNILDLKMSDYIEIPDTTVIQKYAIASGTLNIPPGTSFVNNNKDHKFELKDAQLKKVKLSAGKISISVSNPINTKTIFTVKLPKAIKNGQAISKVFHAPAGTRANPSVVSETIDLSDYEIDLTGSSNGGYNLLQSVMVVQSDPEGNTVSIGKFDSTKFAVTMTNVKIAYARGYFGQLSIRDSTDLKIDFLDKITGGTIDLPFTNLKFIISNGIKVTAKATLNSIVNTNRFGSSIALNSVHIGNPFYVESATGNWASFLASLKTLTFSSSDSNIEQFLENLGSKLTLKYYLQLNPNGNISAGWDEFFPESRLQVKLKANMPLSAALNNLTIQDTFAIDFKNQKDKSHIVAGKLKLKASNAFPLEGKVTVFLLDESGQIVESIPGSALIASSVYGAVPEAWQLQKNNSVVDFILSKSALSQMDQIKKIVVKVTLNTPSEATSLPHIVQIPEGAFMAIKIGTSFQLENQL